MPAVADDLFDVVHLERQGRSVAAELADLDGDGRVDLFVVTLRQIPPREERTIDVYLQRADGSLPESPDHSVPVPRWSAVYDVADLRSDAPGEELVLLGPSAITLLSLADASGKSWHFPVPGPTTGGLADDERGFEPFRMVHREFGAEPWILVPQIGELAALSPEGEVRARLSVPRRANYFIIPSTGLISIETDFQVFLDIPKLSLGDVNGDGCTDFVSSTRHEIWTHLCREGGTYPFEPDVVLPLQLVTPRDHIRGTGGVASEIKDIDGDGLLDLLVSAVSGGFTDAETKIMVFLNDGKGWRLDRPAQTLTTSTSLVSNALYDLDADGRAELVRLEFQFSLLEVMELLLSRELDISFAIHRWTEEGEFSSEPWMKRTLELPISFETMRLRGFVPTATADLNGDGLLDFLTSGGGKALETYLGAAKRPFEKRAGRQKINTTGVIHFRDFNRDGLEDFVIFDPHHFDVPVKIGINRGGLPGSPPALKSQPTP